MDNALFAARVNDDADICEKAQKPKFLGFLTADEAECARRLLNNRRCSTKFFGGYEGAERVMLGCFPDWDEIQDFPVSAVTFTFRKSDTLRHRDFLGALMALGIKRETVGDILTEEGRAVIFVTNEIKGFVLSQVEKIGSAGVKVSEGFVPPLPLSDRLEELSVTAASERLDCVISAICGISRAKSEELIGAGLVTLNSEASLKQTRAVTAGDVISVRTKGRFTVVSLDGRTKKNRIIIKYKRYV